MNIEHGGAMNQTSERLIVSRMVLAVFVLAVSLLNSAKWLMLDGVVAVPADVNWVSRFAGTVAFLVYMAIFRECPSPSTKTLLVIFSILMLFSVSTLFFLGVAPNKHMASVVLYLSGILYGVADTTFIMVFCHVFISFSPAKAAILLGTEQVVSNALVVFSGLLAGDVIHSVRAGVILAGTVLFSVTVPRVLRDARQDTANLTIKHWDYASTTIIGKDASLRGLAWPSLIFVVFLVNFIFGIIAQVNAVGDVGFGLYDVYTGIIVVPLVLLLVVFLRLWPKGVGFSLAVAIVFMAYAVGLLLYLNSWFADYYLAGVFVRSGYDFAFILFASTVARKCFAEPKRAFYLGVLYFFVHITSVYIGRVFGVALLGGAISQMKLIPGIAWVLLLLLFAACVVAFYLATRANAALRDAQETLASSTESGSLASEQQRDGKEEAVLSFAQDICLTRRESEVLTELLRGRSRASIAAKLYLSPETVKSHMKRIYAKAGVSSREELTDLAEERCAL